MYVFSDSDDDGELSANLRRQGNELFKQSRFVEARKKYLEALANSPDCYLSRCNLVSCALKLSNNKLAKKNAKTLIRMCPDWWKANLRLAEVYKISGTVDKAIVFLNNAIEQGEEGCINSLTPCSSSQVHEMKQLLAKWKGKTMSTPTNPPLNSTKRKRECTEGQTRQKKKKRKKVFKDNLLVSATGNDKETIVLWQDECQKQSAKANLSFGKNFQKKREKWIRIAKELSLWLQENSGATEGEKRHATARIAKIRKDYEISDAEFEQMEAEARYIDPKDEPADDGGISTKFYPNFAFSLPRPFQCLVNSITEAFGVAWYYTFWTLPHSKFPEGYSVPKKCKKGVEVHIYGAKECTQYASEAVWRIANTHSELVRKYKPQPSWFTAGNDPRTPAQKAKYTKQKRKDYSLGLAHGFSSLCGAEEAKAKQAAEEAKRLAEEEASRKSINGKTQLRNWDIIGETWKTLGNNWDVCQDLSDDENGGDPFALRKVTPEGTGMTEDGFSKKMQMKKQDEHLQQNALALITRKKIEILEDFKKKHLPKLSKGRKSKATFNTRSLSYVTGRREGKAGRCGKLDAVKCLGKK